MCCTVDHLTVCFGFAYVELDVQDVRLIVVFFARDDNLAYLLVELDACLTMYSV